MAGTGRWLVAGREAGEIASRQAREYCKASTIHGVRYLAEPHRPLHERLCWVGVLLVGLAGALTMILTAWTRWRSSPVVVTLAESTVPLWDVPFPAVTVCPQAKTTVKLFDDYKTEDDDLHMLKLKSDMSVICRSFVQVNGSEYMNQSSVDFIIDVAPHKKEVILVSKWEDEVIEDLFQPIMTSEGVCFTFNMLSPGNMFRSGRGSVSPFPEGNQSVWTPDAGYGSGVDREASPKRSLGAGPRSGLQLLLFSHQVLDLNCRGPVPGFKIMFHSPADIPNPDLRYLMVPDDREVGVGLKPEVMSTEPGLSSYRPSLRQCYFPGERYLAHFALYTQRNCELECFTNETLALCGCVTVFMPRNNSTRICGGGKKTCVADAEVCR